MTSRWRAISALLILVLAAPSAATLQHPTLERGFQADQAFQIGDVDHVNLFNGNLTLTLPIGQSYPLGPDFAYQLRLIWNSKLWDWGIVCQINRPCRQRARPNVDANAGFGWRLHLGELLPPSTIPRNDSDQWLYIGADGAEHLFYPTLHEGETPVAGVLYSRDGTYLRLKTGPRTIEEPNGKIHRFDAQGRVVRIEDPYGNHLAIGYAPRFGSDSADRRAQKPQD